jgi:hypothetical protein
VSKVEVSRFDLNQFEQSATSTVAWRCGSGG